jgi:hypothetical protein
MIVSIEDVRRKGGSDVCFFNSGESSITRRK